MSSLSFRIWFLQRIAEYIKYFIFSKSSSYPNSIFLNPFSLINFCKRIISSVEKFPCLIFSSKKLFASFIFSPKNVEILSVSINSIESLIPATFKSLNSVELFSARNSQLLITVFTFFIKLIMIFLIWLDIERPSKYISFSRKVEILSKVTFIRMSLSWPSGNFEISWESNVCSNLSNCTLKRSL